ncbi:hypothetical protein Q5425_02930 [Amycolatopsis sp. A133]|uniref:hypothetical protein n=1 Tax=Amycolatopsis sp. A133 TaxID=3064472 RepID=UPI0027EF9381|nr:hypothetical protein [Amycolatopsis sp. A133]MDQ7802670.1 hypothetical protein [Amycolatopsis sp. A133]
MVLLSASGHLGQRHDPGGRHAAGREHDSAGDVAARAAQLVGDHDVRPRRLAGVLAQLLLLLGLDGALDRPQAVGVPVRSDVSRIITSVRSARASDRSRWSSSRSRVSTSSPSSLIPAAFHSRGNDQSPHGRARDALRVSAATASQCAVRRRREPGAAREASSACQRRCVAAGARAPTGYLPIAAARDAAEVDGRALLWDSGAHHEHSRGPRMIVQIDFDMPAEIAAGLLNGDLRLFGGVVRNGAGHIVAHLKEASASTLNHDAAGAAARMLKKKPVVVAGLVTLAVVGSVAAAVPIVRKRRRALPECVTNYNDSLRTYLESVRDQSLDAETIERLIADLGAVKAYFENGNVTLDFAAEESETLVQVVMDYTRQLAEANLFDLDELPESPPISTGALVVDLRRYLEIQRKIFNNAA